MRTLFPVLVVFLLCVVFVACSPRPGKFERKMIASIANCKSGAPCILRPKDLTNFTWNRMYVFRSGASPKEMEQAIGAKLDRYEDLEQCIIFMDGRTLVLHEVEPYDPERPVPDEVSFDLPDNSYYKVYEHDAEFSVKKIQFDEESSYYELTQIH